MRKLLQRMGGSRPVSDHALWAAGLTFFGAIGLVPLMMESIALSGRLFGEEFVRSGIASALSGVPDVNGIRLAVVELIDASLRLSWARQALLLFPMSLYGEGLRRAFLQLSVGRPEASTAWRGRLSILPVLIGVTLFVGGVASLGPTIGPLYAAGGWRVVLGVVIAFHVTFLAIGLLLTFAYLGVGLVSIQVWPVLIGSFGAAAFIAGFAQGFLVFLSIPIDWSAPFGGLPVIGTMVALLLWLYGLHFIVLFGYRVALVADANHWSITGFWKRRAIAKREEPAAPAQT